MMRPEFLKTLYFTKPHHPMEQILHYTVASDLYILHTALRKMWWFETVLWAEQTPQHTTVVLSELDEVVPSYKVHEYLKPRGVRVRSNSSLPPHLPTPYPPHLLDLIGTSLSSAGSCRASS
jgi:hypothetical protein